MSETGEELHVPESRGHRTLPHTADVIIDAWAPDFGACCEEAVLALLDLCIDSSGAQHSDRRAFATDGTDADAMLLDVLNEVIFVLDTVADVPIGVTVVRRDGGLDVELLLAPRSSIEWIGSPPKGVARAELAVHETDSGARCTCLVDV